MTIDCENGSGRFGVLRSHHCVILTSILTIMHIDYQALSPCAHAVVFHHGCLPGIPDIQLANPEREKTVRLCILLGVVPELTGFAGQRQSPPTTIRRRNQ